MTADFELKGIIPPLVTPLDDDGALDEQAFRRSIRRMVRAGASGIFILGSSGEFAALTDACKARVIETAVDEVGGKMPVLVGVGDTSTARVFENMQAAALPGVSAIVVCTPYYFPTQQEALVKFYEDIAEKSQVPVVLYNVPQTTKTWIGIETVRRLTDNPNIIGIKDSSGDFDYHQRLISLASSASRFSVLQGDELSIGASVLMGGHGAVPGIANLDPKACVDLYDAAASGDAATAVKMQSGVSSLCEVYKHGGSPVGALKACLKMMGEGSGKLTHPLDDQKPLDDLEILSRILSEHGLI
ncbi:MAG TPA: dihydrodipicolinate synthase family protein [Bacillota bacterium]|mgnify:CR=1 FL=1|jgi:4-hydroxy-tetrahydrodipicolinate synthase|nr:dihydrodipicolinate synthase family protein [Bacillota bacterium]